MNLAYFLYNENDKILDIVFGDEKSYSTCSLKDVPEESRIHDIMNKQDSFTKLWLNDHGDIVFRLKILRA